MTKTPLKEIEREEMKRIRIEKALEKENLKQAKKLETAKSTQKNWTNEETVNLCNAYKV